MAIIRLMFSRRWWWTTLIVVAAIAVTIRLGIWQLDRNTQRQAMIHQITSAQAMSVLDLTQQPFPANLEAFEYRHVTAAGQYDFDHQVALRNQVRTMNLGNEPGYTLVTPLILQNGLAVLVERGWIPLEYNTPASWRQFDEPGIINLEGVLRTSMDKGELGSMVVDPTLAPGQASMDFWNYINLPRLQQQLPYSILNVYIQQAPGTVSGTLPYRTIDQPDVDPGEHIGFAVQWFFFCSLLVVGYPIWLKNQTKKPSLSNGDGQGAKTS